MITPFVQKQQRKNKISYGLSSYGYDARVSNEFKVFTNIDSAFVDPKKFSKNCFGRGERTDSDKDKKAIAVRYDIINLLY